mgnify:FL=1|jgi:hypothetical protein
MLNHLYINGCSHASGWGKGHEFSVTKESGMKSWVDHFAEKTSASELWNHSLIGKPIGMSTIDTYGFCEEYYQRYKTFKDLFVCVEYTLPVYKLFNPVEITTGQFKGEYVIPVSFMSGEWFTNEDPNEKYITMWIRKTKEYLAPQEPEFIFVSKDNIGEQNLNAHNNNLYEWTKDKNIDIMPFIEYAYTEIKNTQQYLEQRNIKYLMYWVGGTQEEFTRFVDQKYRSLYKDNKFIPMTTYSGTKHGTEWSEKPFINHPDAIGHKRIADFIFDWVVKNNLHKTPDIIQLGN